MRWCLAFCAALLFGATAARAEGAFDGLDVRIGRALFNRNWVPAPASTRADDGLGPLFDARSCASCHRGTGRAVMALEADDTFAGRGVVLMLARPDGSPDPVYGRRLQIDAVRGLRPEGALGVRAHRPVVTDLGYGPLDPATGMSLRMAPDLHGRGAIERVPDAALLALETEQAGTVRGRARRVTLADGREAIGRFGWKASQSRLTAQTAEAFLLDLGLSTARYPEPWGDCTANQPACRNAPHGDGGETAVEIPDAVVDRMVAYLAVLPPAKTSLADKAGERVFAAAGCATCHRPEVVPGARLFSDLLLHDLGPVLADSMPEPGAAASEWRTAPLAGAAAALARDTGLLHDGRARTVEAAIGWHGGQSAEAVKRFRGLSRADRAVLLRYVSSL